jgi:RNA polymerase-interacting CarD/CdnL/TRCF family regulator
MSHYVSVATWDPGWSKRVKRNLKRLDSGDAGKVTAVIDELCQCDREYGLGPAERRILQRAVRLRDDRTAQS